MPFSVHCGAMKLENRSNAIAFILVEYDESTALRVGQLTRQKGVYYGY